MVLDVEQHFTPFFWPPFLPSPQIWLYVILHLVDGPNGCASWSCSTLLRSQLLCVC